MYKLDIHCGRWRNYDVIFVWLKLDGVTLQQAISQESMISFFASTGYLLVHRRSRIVYYVVEFETI